MNTYKEQMELTRKDEKNSKILKNFKSVGGKNLYEQLNDIFKSKSMNKKSQAQLKIQ